VAEPRRVLYLAENAISAIQGGGIVVYAVLKGLAPDRLLGFFDYRNITPAPEYADRFVYLGPWRTPPGLATVNRLTGNRLAHTLRCLFAERYLERDFEFITQQVARRGFVPDVVYYSGLSYRYMRLAVMVAEHYDLPMVLLHMDDWMQVEREAAGRWGKLWYRRTVEQMRRAAARSLASTSNSPRLAARLTKMTGYRHVAANNCCADLPGPDAPAVPVHRPNRIPIITYAGAMNRNLQGETLKVLASAVTELNAEGTRVHLHIYTPWEFAPEANSIAVPHAVFYKGQIGRERLADVYRRSDFLVTTVTYRDPHISLFRHSLSTKLSEYLCAGKPVISMGHYDWHLHEYVQEQGCGFSILMDGNFSRAAIKKQLQRILATPTDELRRIGAHNRDLWTRAHDVTVMAADTRRALRIGAADTQRRAAVPSSTPTGRSRRGVIDVGSTRTGWVPTPKATAIARALVGVFDLNAVDLIGEPLDHPSIAGILGYCHDIGLAPTLVLTDAGRLGADTCAGIAAGFAADVEIQATARDDGPAVAAALASLTESGVPVRLTISVEGMAPVAIRALAGAAVQSKAQRVTFRGSNAAPGPQELAALQTALDDVAAAGLGASIRHVPDQSFDEGHRQFVRRDADLPWDSFGWNPAAARWSLAPAQRRATDAIEQPLDLFDQVGHLRGDSSASRAATPVQRAINALSVRVRRSQRPKPVVWLYGSTTIGHDIIMALAAHPWLSKAVTVGGFVSSPGHCAADTIHGYPWRSADTLPAINPDYVLVASETSRLTILEMLAGLGLLDRAIHLYGTGAAGHRYERLAGDSESGDPDGFSAEDYATRELIAAMGPPEPLALHSRR
jgi:glycosyltransferase involved in cell wall biosynthesis